MFSIQFYSFGFFLVVKLVSDVMQNIKISLKVVMQLHPGVSFDGGCSWHADYVVARTQIRK